MLHVYKKILYDRAVQPSWLDTFLRMTPGKPNPKASSSLPMLSDSFLGKLAAAERNNQRANATLLLFLIVLCTGCCRWTQRPPAAPLDATSTSALSMGRRSRRPGWRHLWPTGHPPRRSRSQNYDIASRTDTLRDAPARGTGGGSTVCLPSSDLVQRIRMSLGVVM